MNSRELSLDDIYKAIQAKRTISYAAKSLRLDADLLPVVLTRLGFHFLNIGKLRNYQEIWRIFNYEFLKNAERDELVQLCSEDVVVEKYNISHKPPLSALETVYPGIVDLVILKSTEMSSVLAYLGCTDVDLDNYLCAKFNESFATHWDRRQREKRIISGFFANAEVPVALAKTQLFSSATQLNSHSQAEPISMLDLDSNDNEMRY